MKTTQTYKIGDCLELLQEIPDKSIDLVITDPPYGMNYNSGWYKEGNPFDAIEKDDKFDFRFNNNWLKLCSEKAKKDSCIMVFSSYQVLDEWKFIVSKYYEVKNLIVWVKNNWTAGDLKGNLGNQYEFIIFGVKGDFEIKGYRYSNVWRFDREAPKGHPTTKPVPLIKRAIELTTLEEGMVLDPFLGSGTTLMACRETNRNGIGFEINPDYEPVIKERSMANIPRLDTFAEA